MALQFAYAMMASMPHVFHHKYLKKNKQSDYNKLLNRSVLAMAVIEPLFTLPQSYNVWVLHETNGVSLATWSFFTFAAIVWLLYGLSIKSLPLIISSTLWTVLQGALVIGLIIY
jgi:MtN3 and saliva related transmembrane protein